MQRINEPGVAMTQCLRMHPIHLGFSSPEVERRFVRSRNLHLSALYDQGAWWIHATMNLVAFCVLTAADGDCWRLVGLVATAMALQKLAFKVVGKETYLEHRQLVVCIFRAVYMLATLRGQPSCCDNDDGYIYNTLRRSPYLDLTWHSGLAGMVWYSVALPLTLRNHVAMQLASVLLWGAAVNPPLCSRTAPDPHLGWWVRDSWGWLSQVSQDVLAAAGYPMHLSDPASSSTHTRCAVLLWFLQLAIGFWGSTLVVHQMEAQQRRQFLAKLAQAQPGEPSAAGQPFLTGWCSLYVMGVVLVATWLLVVHLVSLQAA